MSVKVTNHVFEYTQATGAAWQVAVALADWCNHQGRCWPSYAQIARRTRLTRGTVALALAELVRLGEWERVSHGRRPTTSDEDDDPTAVRAQWRNSYRFLFFKPPREVARQSDQQVVRPADQQVVGQSDHLSEISTADPQVVRPPDHLGSDLESAGSPIGVAQVVRSTGSHIRNKPSGDPSEELKAGAPPRPPDEIPDANVGVITKIAHEAIDQLGPKHLDLSEAVKSLCAQRRIAYDGGVVRKAIESAVWQREHPSF